MSMACYYLAAAAAGLALLLLHAPLTDAQTLVPSCGDSGNYTEHSTYHVNIQYLATSLPSYASSSPSLFASGSTGIVPDAIFALALCRGDTNSSSCATCVAAAIQSAQKLCPLVKTVIVYDDTCILRFSNKAFPISPTSHSQRMVLVGTSELPARQLHRLLRPPSFDSSTPPSTTRQRTQSGGSARGRRRSTTQLIPRSTRWRSARQT